MKMDCADLERALLAGEAVDGPGFAPHLEACAACRSLAAEGAPLARGLAGAAPPAPELDAAALAALEGNVLGAVAADRGVLADLRARPRGVRLALVVTLALCEAALVFLALRRGDWDAYPRARMLIVLAAGALVAGVAAGAALRPLYLPAPGGGAWGLALIAVLALPFAFAALPAPVAAPAMAAPALPCLALGSGLALAVLLVLRLVDRGGSGLAQVAAAVAGGYVGLVGLQLHCPIGEPWHLVSAHAVIPLGLALLTLAARRLA
jgi:hypothetical protein